MTTAFVLAGGGSLGAVEVGMLAALEDADVRPDLVVGTSVGAVNAAWLGSGAAVGGLIEVWNSLSRNDIFPIRPVRGLLGFVGLRDHLVPNTGLRRLLRRNLSYERLEDAVIGVHVGAADVLSGAEVLLSTGDAIEAVLASTAVPGVFPPVLIDDRHLVDGGAVNNTPVSHAVALGADPVWVLPTGYACALPAPPSSALGMALQALTLLVNHRLALDVERYADAVTLRVVPTLCPLHTSPADFSQSRELIDRAREQTREWLAAGADPVGAHRHS
ncbi:patatin-like phospholipase family protein [Lentzea tibetensis]|uniref:Patatin-like phospholipase family protein n=1 Tax=Lentzea tibetensis TaxID=2591470 RepID=A0A563ELE4_9PSEU|nr:patatin-like phospholipase family protein [Lentzea tibetensis]TWP47575.1 patatin-like phospholipase family protein [Lentzea tibetensis]